MIEKCIGVRKSRQLYRLIRHFKVTFLCLLLTLLVLRGTLGAGKFGTPEQDFLLLRHRFSSRKLSLPRALEDNASGNNSSGKEVLLLASNVDDDTDKDSALLVSSSSLALQRNVVMNYDRRRRREARVLLVTGLSKTRCENPLGEYHLLKSIKNKIDYCRLHGIEIYYNAALLDAEFSGFWAKLVLIRGLLVEHPELGFIWWMDSDVMFTNMTFEVPWERYESYNLVLYGLKEMVYDDQGRLVLNTGSFLIRNCQWSLDLIGLRTEELKNRPEFEADDQSDMVAMLAEEKEKRGSKVYLENEYYLHGFLEDLVGRFEEMLQNYHSGFGEHRWPLLTRFVGCKPCAKMGHYARERCLKQMERAFNFGHDQISRMSSTRVRRVQNGTSTLQEVKHETAGVSSS